MNDATHAILRELLMRWLADPDRDLEDAVAWCERYLARLPYSLIEAPPERIAYQAGGAYRLAHPDCLNRWTRLLTGGAGSDR